MRHARNPHSSTDRLRRTVVAVGLLVPISAGLAASSASALAATDAHRPALCTPHHPAGCDGTDSPDWDGKHGHALQYCGPDGTCGPVDPAAAARDTARYGDPRSR